MDIIPTYTLVKHREQYYILDEVHYPDTDPCHPHGWYHVYRWFPILSLDRISTQAQADLNKPVRRVGEMFLSESRIPLHPLSVSAPTGKDVPDYYLQLRQEPDGKVYDQACNDPTGNYIEVQSWMEQHITLRKEEIAA